MKIRLTGKDPDAIFKSEEATDDDRANVMQWFEFGEYFDVELDIDPETGRGTVRMMDPSNNG